MRQSNPNPPIQNAERIIFIEGEGTTEAIVQIQYQGDPDDFAWVVPVLGRPTLGTADPALFDDLDSMTSPTFQFQFPDRTDEVSDGGGCGWGFAAGGDDSLSAESGREAEIHVVTVIGRESVGPFETAVITSESPSAISDWLTDNGYQVPEFADGVLSYYVERDAYFVALKLRSELGVDALEPLSITYPSDLLCIPLRLTRVASTPSMPIIAFVIGSSRYRPGNFEHADLDWSEIRPFGGMTDYPFVALNVVNAYGGKAFITEFAQPTGTMATAPVTRATRDLLARGPYLTRLFTEISVGNMDEDPWFEPDTALADVSNIHPVDLRDDPAFARAATAEAGTFAYAGLAPVGLVLLWLGRRRRS